jgi:hypothetical protein
MVKPVPRPCLAPNTFMASIVDTLDADAYLSSNNVQAQHPTSPLLGQEGSNPPPPYTYRSTSQPHVVIQTAAAVVPEPREPPDRRFIKAFLVAVSLWVLAGILISSTVERSQRNRLPRWVNLLLIEGFFKIGENSENLKVSPPMIKVAWTSVSDPIPPRLPPFTSDACGDSDDQ